MKIQIHILLFLSIFLNLNVAQANTIISHDILIIQFDIKKTIKRTINLLSVLDNDSYYGDLGWSSSLTLGSAINKLKNSLKDVETVNLHKIKEYITKVENYFNNYIVEDLNNIGLQEYTAIQLQQDKIMVKAIHSFEGKIR